MIELRNRNSLLNCMDKLTRRLLLVYVFAVLLYQGLNLLIPVQTLLIDTGLNLISSLLAVMGFGLVCLIFLLQRDFWRGKYLIPLLMMVAAMVLSAFLNAQYGLVKNAKVIIWQINQMFILFYASKLLTKEEWRKFSYFLYWICGGLFAVGCIVSFGQYFLQVGFIAKLGTGTARQGFLEGRLFGTFSSPHFASVFAIFLLFASVFYAARQNNKGIKFVHIALAVIYFFYAVLSGTRSVIAALLGCAVIVPGVLAWKHMRKRNRGKIYSAASIFFVVVCCVALVLALFSLGKKISIAALETFSEYRIENEDMIPNPSGMEPEPFELDETELIRPDVTNQNISNSRFRIWSEYLRITCDRPSTFLFGASAGGYMVYARENYPDFFIVNYIRQHYPNMYAHDLIYDTHNSLVTVFVSTGVIGLFFLLWFLGWIAWDGLKYIGRQSKLSGEFIFLFGSILFFFITSLFDSDLFYRCTSTSVFFWWILGLFVQEIHGDQRH